MQFATTLSSVAPFLLEAPAPTEPAVCALETELELIARGALLDGETIHCATNQHAIPPHAAAMVPAKTLSLAAGFRATQPPKLAKLTRSRMADVSTPAVLSPLLLVAALVPRHCTLALALASSPQLLVVHKRVLMSTTQRDPPSLSPGLALARSTGGLLAARQKLLGAEAMPTQFPQITKLSLVARNLRRAATANAATLMKCAKPCQLLQEDGSMHPSTTASLRT